MRKVFLFGWALVALAACSQGDGKGEGETVINMLPQTRAIELTGQQREFVGKTTDFSFNLFRAVNRSAGTRQSSIVSPISVAYVLGMLNDGAAGNTAREITSVLGFGEGDVKGVNEFFRKLIMEAPATDPSVTLRIANTVIANRDWSLKLAPQYERDMKDYYDAEVFSFSFADKPAALSRINGWCREHTEGMIPTILNEDELTPDILLLLMNALYFKATWTDRFDEADTRPGTFTTAAGSPATLPMMHRKAYAQYGEDEYCSMLNIPYGSGDKWSMRVLLPKEGKTVEDVIDHLTAASWQALKGDTWNPQVDIRMPRFSTTSETDLIEPLTAMGTPSMFMPAAAEFPHISSNYTQGIYVGLMKQKAAIEVTEEGTKTAAVTVADILKGEAYGNAETDRPMSVDFHCTRPFVYLIQEASSGVVFFIGTFRG